MIVEKLIILGSGPAGLSAAIYASREGFNPLVIGGYNPGGQLLLTTVVENYPGFPDGIDGPVLISQLRKQAEKFGTRFIDTNATAVDFSSKPFKVTADEKVYGADSIIIATGANAKWLGIDSEKKFIGHGVSNCATCDGPFYKGKDVIVVGGGDTAMEDSIFLTRFANSVTIVHRRDGLKASKVMQERAKSNPKIKFIWNTGIEEILGETSVSSVRLKNVLTNEVSEMKIGGVFVAIGYNPNTEIFKGIVKLDEKGYIVPIDEVKTGIDGVFVAGDVADHFYRQAATASGSGVKAALHVREYLSNLEDMQKSRT
ncbi:MAG: thioredoxin-disulfide reductase [Candidatus Micrarchaeota archaeon]|nr:thioredoxin-disulfide reductase [Candidatus Micrarchaeota archaeon]MDE1834696.1 thioredoxin-disulfide reductase [Candidatus Micrarchaeota archaeon]MDE1859721.1 thioredoxin-disulfide reductase [Candidatus Micrarchaeota archaeon]